MPRTSLSVLEVLIRRLRGDAGLDDELRRNLLTRCRGLARRGLTDEEMDGAVMSVLLRRDMLLSSGETTLEAKVLRVRQSEQIHKQANALRRLQRRPVPTMPTRRPVPSAGGYQPVQMDEDEDHDGDGGAEAAESEEA